MRPRNRADITIKRPTSNGDVDVLTVPITERSTRKFSLMTEDCIELAFSLGSAVHLAIGDYVIDELFGKFVITEDQMPTYNTTTGGYDYVVRFNAWYYVWKNYLHCLVADGQRMEASWTLTERLTVQAQQIVENLNALGITGCSVSVSATNAQEVKCVKFTGISILEAMKMIADAWECEWWVEGKVIHFGKCESGTPVEFELGVNVESMSIANNRNSYANRIYAFGGTQNVPESYDRVLIFTADTYHNGHWSDSARPLTHDMVDVNGLAYTNLRVVNDFNVTQNANITTLTAATNGWEVLYGTADIKGKITLDIHNNLTVYVNFSIMIYAKVVGGGSVVLYTESGEMNSPLLYREINIDGSLTPNAYNTLYIQVKFTNTGGGTLLITRKNLSLSSLVVHKKYMSAPLILKPIGSQQSYNVTYDIYNENYGSFTFDNGVPSDFGIGSRYTLSPLISDIPSGYYTADYTIGALSKVGARRIHLPLDEYPHRYMDGGTFADNSQIVEKAIVFDKIFPRLELKITEVSQKIKRDTIEHEDGTISYENWVQYSFKCSRINGTAFDFNTRYLLPNFTLTANFTASQTIDADSGFMLAGMTFDVGFNNDTQEYTIIRNDNYGVSLPEGTLKPSIGDTFFLTGWNPRAITDLGLVEDAEQELAIKTQEYLDAIEQGQFTFTCNMMSDVFFGFKVLTRFYADGKAFVTKDGEYLNVTNVQNKQFYAQDKKFKTNDGKWFYVEIGDDDFIMPTEGMRVIVIHGALLSSKQSRVIAYQFKLDKPFDSPQYTIGETQPYSRLAKIEKEIIQLQ